MSTVIGLAGNSNEIDGTGTVARLNLPQGLCFDSLYSYFYIMNCGGSNSIHKVTLSGFVTSRISSSKFFSIESICRES